MTRVFLFSLGFGAYSFAALVITQHYADVKKLPKPLLLFVFVMALNFVVRAWVHLEFAAPLHGLALGTLGILISLLPTILHHYLNTICKRQTNYRVTYSLFAASVLTALPVISTANFGASPPDAPPWSYSKWFWINASNFSHVAVFLLNSSYVLTLVWRSFKHEYHGRAKPWFGPLHHVKHRSLRLMSYILAGVSLNTFLLTLHCFSIGPPSVVSLAISLLFVALSIGLLSGMLGVRGTTNRTTHDANYARSGLTESDLKRIKDKLIESMEKQSLYQDSDLTLTSLASSIHEKSAHISQCLSQCYHIKFFEFVNRYRVEFAQSLLAEKPDMSVLEISEMSGFSSKSSFYSAFKRHVGATPKEYQCTPDAT